MGGEYDIKTSSDRMCQVNIFSVQCFHLTYIKKIRFTTKSQDKFIQKTSLHENYGDIYHRTTCHTLGKNTAFPQCVLLLPTNLKKIKSIFKIQIF